MINSLKFFWAIQFSFKAPFPLIFIIYHTDQDFDWTRTEVGSGFSSYRTTTTTAAPYESLPDKLSFLNFDPIVLMVCCNGQDGS